MDKLIVVIMGPGNENFIQMAYNSVKDADKVVYFTSDPRKRPMYLEGNTYFNEWDESDKQINGKSRNVYLNYLKANHPDDWCLVIDEDEVVEDINKVKEFIQTAEPALYSVKMEHFIGDLGHLDNTTKEHFVPNRLFKISEAKEYPEDSHPILTGGKQSGTRCTTIWHLGHLPVEYMHYIVKRGNEHLDNSTIHTKKFLKDWKNAHLFGTYPTRQFNITEIPKVILDNFKIDFDELYFHGRDKMEAKHYQDAIDWKKFFKPKEVMIFGCGFGQRVDALNQIGVSAFGIELSKYAVDNAISNWIVEGDISTSIKDGESDLIVAYDVLEHLKYEDLTQAIRNLKKTKKYILISVPFKGTSNCDADPTHIIKEDRDWWISKFTDKGLELIKTPDHFQFKEQLLIFKGGKK